MTGQAWRRLGCLRVFRPRPDCAARVVCFPHAGGTATTFLPLASQLPASIELVAVQYSGRQDRRREPPADNLRALAAEAAADLAPLADRPLTLFGHSMGALVAFETALLLDGQTQVVQLIASAAWPPGSDWSEPRVDVGSDEAIVAELRRLGGLADAVLHDHELLAEVLRIIRADQRLLGGYAADADAMLSCPITALLGDADPKNTVEQVTGWARHTSSAFAAEVVRGGHFYLQESSSAAASLIAGRVSANPAGTT